MTHRYDNNEAYQDKPNIVMLCIGRRHKSELQNISVFTTYKSMQTIVFHLSTRTTKPKKVIQAKAIQTTAKVNCNLMTKPRDRGCGAVNRCKTRTHFGDRPTIPLLIIQSNFGEELQVEAGLPSFMHRQRVHLGGKQLLRQSNRHLLNQGAFYRAGFRPPTNTTAQTLRTIP